MKNPKLVRVKVRKGRKELKKIDLMTHVVGARGLSLSQHEVPYEGW